MGIIRGMFIAMLFITEKIEKAQHVKKIELDRIKCPRDGKYCS